MPVYLYGALQMKDPLPLEMSWVMMFVAGFSLSSQYSPKLSVHPAPVGCIILLLGAWISRDRHSEMNSFFEHLIYHIKK